jgi:pSer/pThr/pTyr-binding forkhead associated (FHA) protein
MSNLQRCEAELHYYNVAVFDSCPQCKMDGSQERSEQNQENIATGTKTEIRENNIGKTEPVDRGKGRHGSTIDVAGQGESNNPFDNASKGTIIITGTSDNTGTSNVDDFPVVGWLIIVEGPGKGKDFRLIQASNSIGRDKKMDVCLDLGSESDNSISRDAHAVIVYDNNANEFFIERGASRNLPMINGKTIRSDQDLQANDLIQLGQTKLMFFPLCSDIFKWS